MHVEENMYHVSEVQMKYVLDVKAKNSIALSGNTISNENLETYVSESLESGTISLEDFKKTRF